MANAEVIQSIPEAAASSYSFVSLVGLDPRTEDVRTSQAVTILQNDKGISAETTSDPAYQTKKAQLLALMDPLLPGFHGYPIGCGVPYVKIVLDSSIVGDVMEWNGEVAVDAILHTEGNGSLDYAFGVPNGSGWSGPETKCAVRATARAASPKKAAVGTNSWSVDVEFLTDERREQVFARYDYIKVGGEDGIA